MDGQTIYSYSRADALADGSLVDVSETAREAGFTFPVALTADLHADISAIPKNRSYESYAGRLWDVLVMCHFAIRRGVLQGDRGQYKVFLSLDKEGQDAPVKDFDEAHVYWVKAVIGPGDDLEPVFTLMKREED